MCEICYTEAIIEAIIEESQADPKGIPTIEVVHALMDIAASFISGIPDKGERQTVAEHYASHLEAIVEERHARGDFPVAVAEVTH